MQSAQEWSLKHLLKADIVRHRRLFGDDRPITSAKLWLGMLAPRFLPNLLYRLSYTSQRKGVRVLAKFFSLVNFLVFGIEIATVCKIGPGLFFPHTHGTVIGAMSIGENAVIYQGVTLGAKDLNFTYDAEHRPTIGDNIVLGAGAKVLGGVVLGDGVVVAANAVVLRGVPDNVVVGGVPAKVIKGRNV